MRTNITTFLVFLAVYQLFISIRVVFSSQYTVKQKVFQFLIIWFIPFFGAMICHIFVVESLRPLRRKQSSFIADESSKADGF